MKNSTKKIIITIVLIILLLIIVFVIPIAINESYMRNSGYMTVWSGADVLSFYGSIIGTIGTLALGCIAWMQNSRLIKLEENTFLGNNSSTLILSKLNIQGFSQTACNFEEHSEQIVKTKYADLSKVHSYSSLDFTFIFDVIDNYPNLVRVKKVLAIAEDMQTICMEATAMDTEYSITALSSQKCIFNCTFLMSNQEKNDFIKAILNTDNPIVVEAEVEFTNTKYVVSTIKCNAKLKKVFPSLNNDTEIRNVMYATEDLPSTCFLLGSDIADKKTVKTKNIHK